MAESKSQKNKTLLIWEGPERQYVKRDKKFYTQMTSLIIVIAVVLTLAGQFMIILLLLSLLFATYALYSTPPGKTTYVITTEGIEYKDELVRWDEIESYAISTPKNFAESTINLDLKKSSILKQRYLIPNNRETLEKAVEIIDERVSRKSPKGEEKGTLSRIWEKIGLSLREE